MAGRGYCCNLNTIWMLTNDAGLRQHGGMFVRPKQPNRLNLTGAKLAGANLSGANLFRANLTGANLTGANLSEADLSRANLTGANLTGANLSEADLSEAKLIGANLTGANLSRANLTEADLSQCKGLPVSPHVFLETHPDGVIAYKAFGNTTRQALPHWVVEVGAVIEEPGCNPDRFTECGSGVNVASTLTWVKANYPDADSYWRVRIKWDDLPNTVVPYTSDGKYRTTRITLLEKVG